MEVQMDDFTVSPFENLQPWDDRRQYSAEIIDGGLKASIVLRWYGDKPSGYVIDHSVGRVNDGRGMMGPKQREQANVLGVALEERVRNVLIQSGWRIIGSTRLAIDIWHYFGSAIVDGEKQLEHLARRVWHGSYPWQQDAKVAPLDEALFGELFVAHRWYPLGDELEVALDPSEKLLRVRRQHKRGAQEEQQREASSQRVAVIGDQEARSRGDIPAFHRTRTTRAITFRCAWCATEVTQERYPSPKPMYCSDTCEKEAGREKTRKRVQKFREQREAQKQREKE